MKIEKDQIVNITTGEYSDYVIITTVIALRDFDTSDAANEYFAQHPEQKERYEFKNDQFVHHLIERAYLKELDAEEWCLGSYLTYEYNKEGPEYLGD